MLRMRYASCVMGMPAISGLTRQTERMWFFWEMIQKEPTVWKQKMPTAIRW